jgi:hypothetical protein
MQWYWFALLAGVALPWVIMGKSILIGFKEKGIQGGLGAWSGICWLTIPLMLLIMWIFHLFVG